MKYLLSFDGGGSTGIVLGEYDELTPYRPVQAWQPTGGVSGFLDWYEEHSLPDDPEDAFYGGWLFDGAGGVITEGRIDFISERFIPIAGGGFNQTSASVEPLRVEGALIALGLLPHDYTDKRWQRASCQVLAGGKTPAERKKNTDDLLRKHGYWRTGKQIGKPDANDVNSAMKHALYYMTRTLKHRPTIELLFPE